MRILLDTHILLWVLLEPDRLGSPAHEAIEAPENDVLFSAANIWEIAIKYRLRRPDFPVAPTEIAEAAANQGLIELTIGSSVAALVADLPLLHRDPFDRLLVAQAIAEPAILFTADRQLLPYSELVRHIGAP